MEQLTAEANQLVKADNSDYLLLFVVSVSFIFLGLLGLIFVAPATARLFSNKKNNAWINIGKYIALLSLFVTTIYFIWFLFTIPNISLLNSPIKMTGWFIFGGMGVWVWIVGIINWRGRVISRWFSVVCAIKAIGFWIILLGIVLGDIALAKTGAIVGGLIGGTLYHAWLGIALLMKLK
jgi:hypothetical protein